LLLGFNSAFERWEILYSEGTNVLYVYENY